MLARALAVCLLLAPTLALAGVCKGHSPCQACADCSRCKHCTSGKGSCSVKRAEADRQHARHSAAKKRKASSR